MSTPVNRSATESVDSETRPQERAQSRVNPDPKPHGGSRIKILMLAIDGTTPYRTLRCAHACGAEVYVLGSAAVRMLRLSRFCRLAVVSDCIIYGGRDDSLALEINNLVREFGIDMVVPTDAPSIRAIIASRDLISAPCFPLPELEAFDTLNNKWAFAQLCHELDIRHPRTRLVSDVATLAKDIDSEAVQFPVIIKPLERCANSGVILLEGPDVKDRLRTVNYRPALVQEFINGEEIGAGVYANAGQIEAFVTHSLRRSVYATFRDDRIYADTEKIVRRFGLSGIYNFDMMRAPDGRVYYLECNPRPFFKMNLSMLAGVNFMERGLFPDQAVVDAWSRSTETKVRLPKALLWSIATSGRISRRDIALLTYYLADPLPSLLEMLIGIGSR